MSLAPFSYDYRQTSAFRYLDEGEGHPVVMLHGMLGGPENWARTVPAVIQASRRALIPCLPVYELPTARSNVPGLVHYVEHFLDEMGIGNCVLAGNSLGGQIAVHCAARDPHRYESLILSGSSGLEEHALGTSTFRRKDRQYIRSRAERTFFDPVHVTEALVNEVFEIINDRNTAIRLIRMARSAQLERVTDLLDRLTMPALLVWGKQDEITPLPVAQTLQACLPNSVLHVLDPCGHAPMMEQPEPFNRILHHFLTTSHPLASHKLTGS